MIKINSTDILFQYVSHLTRETGGETGKHVYGLDAEEEGQAPFCLQVRW